MENTSKRAIFAYKRLTLHKYRSNPLWQLIIQKKKGPCHIYLTWKTKTTPLPAVGSFTMASYGFTNVGREHSGRSSLKTNAVHARPPQQEMHCPSLLPAVDSITPTTQERAEITLVSGHRKQKPPSQPSRLKALFFVYQPPFSWKIPTLQGQK